MTTRSNPIHLWNEDEKFHMLAEKMQGRTLVDRTRSFILYQFAQQVGRLDGDIAEIGVYKGGTAKLISLTVAKTGKTVHLFDTFSGMPPTDPARDVHQAGDFSDTTIESVKEYLKECGNVRFYQGFFPETAAPINDLHFCFVHVDVDIYQSVLDCCKFFYPRTVKGGIIIFDDYGFVSCPGARAAVDEFFFDKSEYPCYLPTGQCFVIKL